jgi:RNA polymerase sigma-70 factor (ECF subfamily)
VTKGAVVCDGLLVVNAPKPLDVNQYRAVLLGHIRNIVKSPTEAEDVLQEVLVRAHQSLEQLRAGAALSTWLFRIATHISVDYLRKRGRQPFAVDTTEPNEPTTLDEPPSLQILVEQREMGVCIQQYILNLPSDYRTVILLHDLEGLTAAEIAETLDLTLANVKMRLHRARASLKTALERGCALSCDCRGVLVCEPKS